MQLTSNFQRIAELEAMLESGATSITNDGVTVQIDLDQVRKELNRLRATDVDQAIRRPRLSSVNLSGLR